MELFLITLGVLVLFTVFMAVGVMMGKAPLKGSCGGLNNLMGQKECSFCGKKDTCDKFQKHKAQLEASQPTL